MMSHKGRFGKVQIRSWDRRAAKKKLRLDSYREKTAKKEEC